MAKYRCSACDGDKRHFVVLMVQAPTPIDAAQQAAIRFSDVDYDDIQVWSGPRLLLTWRRAQIIPFKNNLHTQITARLQPA